MTLTARPPSPPSPRPAAPPGVLLLLQAADQATRLRSIVGARADRVPTRPPSAEPRPRGPVARARVISISSGKGGVGKTNICVNLAIALAELGRRTILLDGDLGMANADVLCGLAPSRRLDAVVAPAPGRAPRAVELAIDAPGGFRLVPGAIGVARMADLDSGGRARLLAALEELEIGADLMLVDTAAGISPGVLSLISGADACLIVATPEPTSMADAYALIKCVVCGDDAARGGTRPWLVVNQASGEREAAGVHTRLAAVCQRFLDYRLPLVGWVPQDAHVGAAVRRRRPLLLDSPRAPASRQIRGLALSLVRALRPMASESASGPRGGLRRVLSALMLRGG